MSEFDVDYAKEKENITDSSSSSFIRKSGIYDVRLIGISPSKSRTTKAIQYDLVVEYEGQMQRLFGVFTVKDAKGDPIQFQLKNLAKFCAVVNPDKDSLGELKEMVLPLGKKGASVTLPIFYNARDVPVTLWVQLQYSLYQGSIKEKVAVKDFFRTADHASGAEIANEGKPNVCVGKQYSTIEKSAYDTFYNQVTPEDVADWVAASIEERKALGKKPAVFGSTFS